MEAPRRLFPLHRSVGCAGLSGDALLTWSYSQIVPDKDAGDGEGPMEVQLLAGAHALKP
jgi:hypothetical protein